jgi:hypothetical protein
VFVREHREHLLKPQVVFMTPVYHRGSLPGNNFLLYVNFNKHRQRRSNGMSGYKKP